MGQTCRACGSNRVLPSLQLFARTLLGGPVVVHGLSESRVSAGVCVDCGAIELKATELAALRAAYAAHDPLNLKAETAARA